MRAAAFIDLLGGAPSPASCHDSSTVDGNCRTVLGDVRIQQDSHGSFYTLSDTSEISSSNAKGFLEPSPHQWTEGNVACETRWSPENENDRDGNTNCQEQITPAMTTTFRPVQESKDEGHAFEANTSFHFDMRKDWTETEQRTSNTLPALFQEEHGLKEGENIPSNAIQTTQSDHSGQLNISSSSSLLYAKREITGGSLTALVKYLAQCECSATREWFVSSLLLTFRQFCKPGELVDALIRQFDWVDSTNTSLGFQVRRRVCGALETWLKSFWVRTTDGVALGPIQLFINSKVRPLLPATAADLIGAAERLEFKDVLTRPTTALAPEPDTEKQQPDIGSPKWSGLNSSRYNQGQKLSISKLSHVHLAHQLTMRQMKQFCTIESEELLARRWTKCQSTEAPNVTAMSHLTNSISNWVKETILEQAHPKARSTIIEKWIRVAHQLFQLRNLDGLVAVVFALGDSSIYRLRATWDTLSTLHHESLHSLQMVTDPSQNHKALRSIAEGVPKPCLPFLGTYLTELVFVSERFQEVNNVGLKGEGSAVSSTLDRVVNWEKYSRTAAIIKRIRDFQHPFPIAEDTEVQKFIGGELLQLELQRQEDLQKEFYQRSLALEPPARKPRKQISLSSLWPVTSK